MEFNQKLQELRKEKGITQEELAKALFVSRTAISKWESGRGYPNIDSLKEIAKFFGVTIDQLLSNNELLILADEDTKQKKNSFRDMVFGLLDICIAMLIFLPFFGQKTGESIQAVSLLFLLEVAIYLRVLYFVILIGMMILGVLTLALQNCGRAFWVRNKGKISLFLNAVGVILFVMSQQPYAATFLLAVLAIKVLIYMKWR